MTEAEFFKQILSYGSSPLMVIIYLAVQGHHWYKGMIQQLRNLEASHIEHQRKCEARFCKMEECFKEDRETKTINTIASAVATAMDDTSSRRFQTTKSRPIRKMDQTRKNIRL
jgi:hypothetical protein